MIVADLTGIINILTGRIEAGIPPEVHHHLIDPLVGQRKKVGHARNGIGVAILLIIAAGIFRAGGQTVWLDESDLVLAKRNGKLVAPAHIGESVIGIGPVGRSDDDFYAWDSQFARILNTVPVAVQPDEVADHGQAILVDNDRFDGYRFALVCIIRSKGGPQFISPDTQLSRIDLGDDFSIKGEGNDSRYGRIRRQHQRIIGDAKPVFRNIDIDRGINTDIPQGERIHSIGEHACKE